MKRSAWLVLLDCPEFWAGMQEVEEVEPLKKGEHAANGLVTDGSFAFGAARKPGSLPATADSVTSMHPWSGRAGGGSYNGGSCSPRSTSPPENSPAPSEADLAQERAPAGSLLQAHMFEVSVPPTVHGQDTA